MFFLVRWRREMELAVAAVVLVPEDWKSWSCFLDILCVAYLAARVFL